MFSSGQRTIPENATPFLVPTHSRLGVSGTNRVRQVRRQLTPVMTAASPAGGVSSSGSSRSSSSRTQRGSPMASRGRGGCLGTRSGALGPGTLGTRGQAAVRSREPGGGYKGEPRGDSRQAARGGHGAGTHPALHAHTRTCPAPHSHRRHAGRAPAGRRSPSQPS